MRITAGTLKNREVGSFKDKEGTLRPTSSKTRMAVFNVLSHARFLSEIEFLDDDNYSLVRDRIVADVYCGTGIMGFEAFSRGARALIFVDKNSLTLDLTKRNAVKLGVVDVSSFIRANATQLPSVSVKPDVIFVDPPYNKDLVAPTLKSLADNMWPRDSGVVVVEHSVKETLVVENPYILLDQREYNNSFITILKVKY